jgi:hypothetical protein
MHMRIIRITAPWVLLLSLTCFWAGAQDAPPRLEVFAEGGGSFLNNGTGGEVSVSCLVCATQSSSNLSYLAPLTSTISKTGRFFTGARLRFTRHDAIEASYSYSPNLFLFQVGSQPIGPGYGRIDLFSVNYVRYLWIRTRVQPFATGGIGSNRFSGGPMAYPVYVPVGSNYVSVPIPADNGWQFAWNYGGGTDIVLRRHLALRLELRDYVTGQPSPLSGTSHNIVPSAGIVFRFK